MLISNSRLAGTAALLLTAFYANSQQQPAAAAPAANSSLLRGQLLLSTNGGVNKIASCDNSRQFPVQLDAKLLQQAQKFYDEHRPIYIEAFGHFTLLAKEPQFTITALNLFSSEINLCSRPTQKSYAFGNGPAWSVTMLKQELHYAPRGAKEQHFKLTSLKNSKSALHFEAKEADLKIQQGFCNDGMSDSVFGWKATFTLAGKPMRGCARLTPQTMNANLVDSSTDHTIAISAP
ncbi:MAG: hypothetical protein ACRC9T_05965 [Vibrionaceae bacterium]